MKVILTDGALRSAAAELREYRLSQLPEEEDFENEFSPEFEAAAQRLERRFETRQSVRKMARSAAAVLLVLAVSLGAWLGVDSEARADFASWLREVYEDSVIYRYAGGRSEDTELPRIELGWVPDGYVLAEENEDEVQRILTYHNAEIDDYFYFSYSKLTETGYTGLVFDETEIVRKQTEVNGMYADAYIAGDKNVNNSLVWIDEQNGIIYTLLAFLNEQDMLRIAETAISSN